MSTFKNYKPKVRTILRDFPETRDSHTKMYIELVRKYTPQFIMKDRHGVEFIQLDNLDKMPNTESARRSMQIIQNDNGEFRPEKVAQEQRDLKERNWRESEIRNAKLI